MTESKSGFSSSLGFIFAALGMAIGCGNVWRFPRMVATYGGGPFIFAWLVGLFLWSFPLLMAEGVMAHKTRVGHAGGFRDFMGPKYAWLGMTCAIILVFLASYYSVIVGYCIKYFVNAATGAYKTYVPIDVLQAAWDDFRAHPGQVVLFHAINVVICTAVVAGGIRQSVEKVCKVAIPALFALCIALSLYLIFRFDSSKIADAYQAMFSFRAADLTNSRIWIEGFTQSAWSTGAGWGLYYSYSMSIPKNSHDGNNAFAVGAGDQVGALVCATMVIPAIFAMSGDLQAAVSAGNFGITFVYVASIFSSMPNGGLIISILFFAILAAAGITSEFAMVETVGIQFVQNFKVKSRTKATWLGGLVIFCVGVPSAIWTGFIANQDWVCGIGLLVAGLLYVIATLKHGATKVMDEYINNPVAVKLFKVGNWIKYLWYFFPVEFAIIVGWWMIQSTTWYPTPAETWNPFVSESTGTVIFELAIMFLLGYVVTKLCYKNMLKGPMTQEEE